MQKENYSQDYYEYVVKGLVIRDPSVGKTTILLSYTGRDYLPFYDCNSTVGVDCNLKSVETEGRTVKMRIWDTAGQ